MQRTLKIREATLGPDHPSVATSLQTLGQLYHTQGVFEKAIPLYEQAVALQEKSFGSDNPTVAANRAMLEKLRTTNKPG